MLNARAPMIGHDADLIGTARNKEPLRWTLWHARKPIAFVSRHEHRCVTKSVQRGANDFRVDKTGRTPRRAGTVLASEIEVMRDRRFPVEKSGHSFRLCPCRETGREQRPVMEDLLSFVGIGQPCAPEKICVRTVPPPAMRRATTQDDAKNEGDRLRNTPLFQWLALGALADEGSAHQRRKLRVRFDESTKASKDSPRNGGFSSSPKSPEELFKVNARVERQIALAKQRASAAARGAHGGHDKDASSSMRRAPSTSSNDSADSSDSKGLFGPAFRY